MRTRFKAARAPYRRGGLVFASTREWVEFEGWPGQVDGLTLEGLVALSADPAIVIEVERPSEGGGELAWLVVPWSDREQFIQVVTAASGTGEAPAAEAVPEVAPPPPSPPPPPPPPPAAKPAAPPKAPKADKPAKVAKATPPAKAPADPGPAPADEPAAEPADPAAAPAPPQGDAESA